MTDHIIQSKDGQTYDLTTNRIAFGLLPKDVRKAMKAWPHGWEIFTRKWEHWPDPSWGSASTYRARPAPKVTEHVMILYNHRIIIRDDGTGNVSATVETL
jgi:hypothetical protein